MASGSSLSSDLGGRLAFKLNQAGRHHIPRQQRKVTNWPAYDASLRQRGSLTVWFTDEAIRRGRLSRARPEADSPGIRSSPS